MVPKYTPLFELGQNLFGPSFLGVCGGFGGFCQVVTYTRQPEGLAHDDDEVAALALDELRRAAHLNHPNIEQLYEAGLDGQRYFVVTEYLDGLSLEALFARGGRAVAIEVYVRVLCDVLAGLHYAHELGCDREGRALGIVHGGLSPRSVGVTCQGDAKVLHFGGARFNDALIHGRTREIDPRPECVPPERLRPTENAPRSAADVYAAGTILFRALAGRRLWEGLPLLDALQHLLCGRLPSTRAAAPHAPAELVAICDRALSPDPADRFPTALAFREALEGYLERSGARPTRDQIGLIVAGLSAGERAKRDAAIEAHRRANADDALPPGPHGHPYRGHAKGAPRPEPSPGEAAKAPPPARGAARAWVGMAFAIAVVALAAAWLGR